MLVRRLLLGAGGRRDSGGTIVGRGVLDLCVCVSLEWSGRGGLSFATRELLLVDWQGRRRLRRASRRQGGDGLDSRGGAVQRRTGDSSKRREELVSISRGGGKTAVKRLLSMLQGVLW